MTGKRYATHTEWEILEVVRRRGWATYRQIMEELNDKLYDPPHPVRVREKLIRLFMKGKLDRVRIKALTFKHGSEYVYFLPESPPQWLREYLKQEKQEQVSNISQDRQVKKRKKR